MSLRTRILLFLFIFALVPLLMAVAINLPLVLDRVDSFYRQAFLQNLRSDFSDLDQHLASRDTNVRLLSRLPEPLAFSFQGPAISQPQAELKRSRYVEWINRILHDEDDITEIRFLDVDGKDRFWLVRNTKTRSWYPTSDTLAALPERQLKPLKEGTLSDVIFSPVRVVLDSVDPEKTLTLQMMAPIFRDDNSLAGAVVITINIGGLVKRDGPTLWVLDDGNYLQLPGMPEHDSSAFDDFTNLAADFTNKRPVLWEQGDKQVIWVPMFVTETGAPLWVGRKVNTGPLAEFRTEMIDRVLAIILGLVILLLFSARLLANRAEKIGSELIEGIQQTLESDEPVEFNWSDNKELKQLSDDLSKLSQRHVDQTKNLRAHAAELEASNRYKSEFLANVSHELRTPLNSILLLSKLLSAKGSGLAVEQHEQAGVIHKASNDLKALIDNILDLSKIEARQFDTHCEDIVVKNIVLDVYELLLPQYQDKGLSFEVLIEANALTNIKSDPDKISQILKNFLANALKFTAQGRVGLEIKTAVKPYDIEFSVVDSGIGIKKQQQQKIFEAFQQADGSTSRRYGGTGLGLTISRQLADLLRGEIHLTSKEGEGARFSLLLPENCDDESKGGQSKPLGPEINENREEMQATLDLSGLNIMVLDSNIKVQLQLTQCLKNWRAKVLLAGDLEEALETVEDSGEISILLMDLDQLESDACARIKTLREMSQTSFQIIGLTSTLSTQDEDATSLLLDSEYLLQKPVDNVVLATYIQTITALQ